MTSEIGITVGRICRLQVDPSWIKPIELELKLAPCHSALAPNAAHFVEPAMQVDHVLASTRLVEPVNVLLPSLKRSRLPFNPRSDP